MKSVSQMKSLRDEILRMKSSLRDGYFSHCEKLVGPSGLEPPTSCLSGTRSNHLSYEPSFFFGWTRRWWRWWDSNPWPPACRAGALPTELHPHIYEVVFPVTENWTTIDSYSAQVQRSISSSFWPICDTTHPWKCVRVSIERRWSSRTFRYGYLVTT